MREVKGERAVVYEFLKDVSDSMIRQWSEFTETPLHAFILSRMEKKARAIGEQLTHPPSGQTYNIESLCTAQGKVSGLEEYGKFFKAVKHEFKRRRDIAAAKDASGQ